MLLGLFDRIIFTCGVVIFLQLPAFIDQYTHRLGGYQRAQQTQIAGFQQIADKNHNGNLNALIVDFSQNNTSSVRDTAANIRSSLATATAIDAELSVLESQNLTKKLFFLITNFRYKLVTDTLKHFNPSFPLNLQSLLYGLVGGILATGLFGLIFRLPTRLLKKKKPKNEPILVV